MASSGVQSKKTLKKRFWLCSLRWSAKALKNIDRLLGVHLFSTWFRPKFGSKDYLAAGVMRPILVKSVQEELWPLLQKLQTPTLLLWGEKDTETPLEIAIRMEKALPNASLISLPFSGHLLMEENPSLCAYFIEKFLLRETACY
jgi:pimeloyl-ACP methyl ester carboxylesterase